MWRHIPNISPSTLVQWSCNRNREILEVPIYQAYFSGLCTEYPHKIWYSTFIFGSWNYEIPIDPAWNPPSPHGILLRLTRHVGRALVKSSITWGWNIALWDMGESDQTKNKQYALWKSMVTIWWLSDPLTVIIMVVNLILLLSTPKRNHGFSREFPHFFGTIQSP